MVSGAIGQLPRRAPAPPARCRPAAGRASRRIGLPSSRVGALFLALLGAGLLGACASTPGTPAALLYALDDLPAGQAIVWPAPPEAARFIYAGSLSGERNFAAAAGTSRWRAFGRWLVGLDEADKTEALQRPSAVLTDAAGRVYVSDVGRQGVFVFDVPDGRLQVWERAGGLLRFNSPTGLALAPGGGLFVADAQLGVVVRLNAQGEPRAEIGRGTLQRPTGLARDAAHGLLYVADTQAHDIKAFDERSGALRGVIGARGDALGRFNFPTHLAFAQGALYVTDTFNHRVQVLSGPGLSGPHIGQDAIQARAIGARGLQLGDLVRPKGVAVDDAGRVYVVESYYDSLLVYDAQGEFLLPVGAGAGSAGLVADRWGVNPSSAAAAPSSPAPAPNGTSVPVAAARFYLPAGVWADAAGQVWVADQFRSRVVRLRYIGPDAVAPASSQASSPAALPASSAASAPASAATGAGG
jgi:DNA-binding beta-propeller fold protein YncE